MERGLRNIKVRFCVIYRLMKPRFALPRIRIALATYNRALVLLIVLLRAGAQLDLAQNETRASGG